MHRFLLIFTDLDGTLLEHDSYSWDDAAPALELCKRRRIPVILVSSKTRAEINLIRLKLGLTFPFVSENGGGVFFPKESERVHPQAVQTEDLWKWSLGPPYDFLVRALREIGNEVGVRLTGFSDMPAEKISLLTGLDLEDSRLASFREYDEPFVLPAGDEESLSLVVRAAQARGLSVSEGGRFYHLHGGTGKGEAVEELIRWYRTIHPCVTSVGLGDSPNDFDMLQRVDYPVLVRSSRSYPEIDGEIPGVKITTEMGPRGWNRMVLDILSRNVADEEGERTCGRRPG